MARGRLYRAIPPPPGGSLFRVGFSGPYHYDNEIVSVDIHRGVSEPGASALDPTTLEVTLKGRHRPIGARIWVELSHSGKAVVEAATGGNGPTMAARFTGRTGIVEYNDNHTLSTSTIRCASWAGSLLASPRRTLPVGGTRIDTVVGDALAGTGLETLAPLTAHGTFDFLHATPEQPATFAEHVDKLVGEPGQVIADRRDGSLRLMTSQWRIDDMTARAATDPHLTRSQAIRPATWSTVAGAREKFYFVDYRDDSQVVHAGVPIGPGAGPTGGQEKVTLDRTGIRYRTDQWRRGARALAARERPESWRVPSIEVDLLMLMTSPYQYHRTVAGHLLTLNPHDPVYLAGDWDATVRGAHVCLGIDERISKDAWTLTLALAPVDMVLGSYAAEHPTIPARVWRSARTTWATTPGTWQEATP